MSRERKFAKREALEAVRKSPKGVKDAFCDLLQCELEETWGELETAQDNAGIWRAQGRATQIRSLMTAIKKEG